MILIHTHEIDGSPSPGLSASARRVAGRRTRGWFRTTSVPPRLNPPPRRPCRSRPRTAAGTRPRRCASARRERRRQRPAGQKPEGSRVVKCMSSDPRPPPPAGARAARDQREPAAWPPVVYATFRRCHLAMAETLFVYGTWPWWAATPTRRRGLQPSRASSGRPRRAPRRRRR